MLFGSASQEYVVFHRTFTTSYFQSDRIDCWHIDSMHKFNLLRRPREADWSIGWWLWSLGEACHCLPCHDALALGWCVTNTYVNEYSRFRLKTNLLVTSDYHSSGTPWPRYCTHSIWLHRSDHRLSRNQFISIDITHLVGSAMAFAWPNQPFTHSWSIAVKLIDGHKIITWAGTQHCDKFVHVRSTTTTNVKNSHIYLATTIYCSIKFVWSLSWALLVQTFHLSLRCHHQYGMRCGEWGYGKNRGSLYLEVEKKPIVPVIPSYST